jgi:hypothetical protein
MLPIRFRLFAGLTKRLLKFQTETLPEGGWVRQFEILDRIALTIHPTNVPAPSIISGTPDKLISSRKVLSMVH